MGKFEVGMIFVFRGVFWVKLGLWESIFFELSVVIFEELIYLEYVVLF